MLDVSNLDRLGILRLSNSTASDVTEYGVLEEAITAEFAGYRNLGFHAGTIEVTPLGRQFLGDALLVLLDQVDTARSAPAKPGVLSQIQRRRSSQLFTLCVSTR